MCVSIFLSALIALFLTIASYAILACKMEKLTAVKYYTILGIYFIFLVFLAIVVRGAIGMVALFAAIMALPLLFPEAEVVLWLVLISFFGIVFLGSAWLITEEPGQPVEVDGYEIVAVNTDAGRYQERYVVSYINADGAVQTVSYATNVCTVELYKADIPETISKEITPIKRYNKYLGRDGWSKEWQKVRWIIRIDADTLSRSISSPTGLPAGHTGIPENPLTVDHGQPVVRPQFQRYPPRPYHQGGV